MNSQKKGKNGKEESSCRTKETVATDILVTPSNGDRKIKQSIRIMSAPPMKGKKRNQSSKFR